jgi:hypothetical protein
MIIILNSIRQFIFVKVECGVIFEVRTDLLNIIQTSFGFKGLILKAKSLYFGILGWLYSNMLFHLLHHKQTNDLIAQHVSI